MINVPIRVRDALRDGTYLKNYKFTVYETDETTVDFVIENDRLVSESVKIDERMCSDKELKFGLCEGTNLEFQAFNVPNITGRRIFAKISVQYKDENGDIAWHNIPIGWFTVDECSRQASTGILKIKCYNKLLSDYLNNKANEDISEIINEGEIGSDGVSIYVLLEKLLEGYSIDTYTETQRMIDPYISISMASSYADAIYFTGENLNSLGVYQVVVNFSLREGVDWDPTTYYNLVFLINKIQEKINEIYEPYFDYMVDPSTYSENVKLRNYIHLTSEQEPTIQRFSGCIWIYFVGPWPWEQLYLTRNIMNETNTVTSGHRTNMMSVQMEIPVMVKPNKANQDITAAERAEALSIANAMFANLNDYFSLFELEIPEIDKIRLTDSSSISDVTIRDLQTAVYETVCQFGKLDRVTDLFSGVELNNARLYPADSLYPANDLYPISVAERGNPAMYSKLWADEGNVRSFRYLIITYKTTETEEGQTKEVEKKLQRTVNANGTDDYNMSDNWLFRNLIWTDEQVGDYADAMVEKMQDITWFPFEMWCAGLPYIETGDEIEIATNEGAYTSYVLRRNLKGIQDLQDEMINGELDIF